MKKMIQPKILSAAVMLLLVITISSSCKKKSEGDDELAAKKEELAKYRDELFDLQQKISELEAEIALTDSANNSTLVGVQEISADTFLHYIEVQGMVDAKNNVMASPQMPGVVTAIYVEEGQKVSRGQTLAQLDDALIRQGMQELETGLELATTAYEKQKKLWDQKIGSEMQYLAAKNQKEQLEKKKETLNAQLEMAKITAPVDGTVDEIKVKIGEMAAPGYAGIRVVNLNALSVKAKLGDNYVGRVSQGDNVKVMIPDLNKTIDGKVSFVSQQVNTSSRTISMEVALENKDNDLKANMTAQLMVNDELIKDALIVPTNAIMKSANGFYVFVAEKDGEKTVAKKRVVEKGLEYNGQTVIVSGLTAGDIMVTFGYSEIIEGEEISF